ncbi:GxxExxY protein [Candidatus Parcubacteria bacterium]|nr:GxxExxY protein [Candidatus Parcubacteria bacterium]
MLYNKNNNLLYPRESELIYESYKEVWKNFGGAFKESVISKSATIALQKKGLTVIDQKRINIYFEYKKVGVYIPDKVINNIILIEEKCKPFITMEDKKQFWYYLKATDYKLGFLVNFSPKSLEFIRRIYDTARQK